MVACEPVDSILATLLQANDDLLAAVNSWDTTASRLVMLQSKSATAATTSAPSQPTSPSHGAAPPGLSNSSSSPSDMTPTPAASGGVFWSRLEAEPSRQVPRIRSRRQQAHQQQQLPQANPAHQSYPSLLDSSFTQRQEGAAAGSRQRPDSSKMPSSSSNSSNAAHVAGQQPQNSHHQQPILDRQIRNHEFGAGASMPAASSSDSMTSGGHNEAAFQPAQARQEFHGSVLSYRLASPKHTEGADQQSPFLQEGNAEAHLQGTQPWPQAAAEAQPSGSAGADVEQLPFDPFAGKSACSTAQLFLSRWVTPSLTPGVESRLQMFEVTCWHLLEIVESLQHPLSTTASCWHFVCPH